MADLRRVFVLVLDSLGVGALPDAGVFGDAGAHTLDHLAAAAGGLVAPRLAALGLGNVPGVHALAAAAAPEACFGRMAERSPGKDTSTGHWEMMGCPLERAFPVFEGGFPAEIVDAFVARAGVPGVLGNCAASGTTIIAELGEEHARSGKPIVYTSADSVFQVAAHEQHFGLERLYECCAIAREILLPYGVGRVIARPFVGEPGAYRRTYNRRDYSLEPPHDTVLDLVKRAGLPVVGVGKIGDIFAGRGLTEDHHTEGNRDGMRVTTEVAARLERGFVFLNLVDFDMLFGHRRDPAGYRRALEEFDEDYARFERELRPGDLVLLTADHGNDPTHTATTDHTREYVPLLATGPGLTRGRALGTRASFADVGATVAEALGVTGTGHGSSFLAELLP
ncbi:MAG: phosphopentomutase [Planctomycetes bacterium]|nr:phosphopentomutase [Planctomycetota bacterium]